MSGRASDGEARRYFGMYPAIVTNIVDEKSLLYLDGTELDYVEDVMGAGFEFKNPNVQRSCACGSSFTV